MGHTYRYCAKLLEKEEEEVTRDWGIWLKAPMRRMGDTSDARWLRDGMGGAEQLGECASPIPPNLGHGYTVHSN